jgi:hypothetical protein
MDKPYYFRALDYSYNIKSHSDYFFVTGVNANRQFLLLEDSDFDLLIFDKAGCFLERKIFLEPDCESVFRLVGAQEEMISVKRFWIEDLEVGIEDFPSFIKEYILEPSTYDELESVEAK